MNKNVKDKTASGHKHHHHYTHMGRGTSKGWYSDADNTPPNRHSGYQAKRGREECEI